ncbi:hypothetical protein ITJ66_07195 [Plantibacter sp. VKM Ac-2885]|uniref:hypothetical protein n=1 Tax=Plantibacter sp. VKM Ac-2885 TaxID=2783828 RepID=UPI00188A361E|nr:hypothetical protein [Plantibacter sp. VKM Ac-2885]MBF4512273.1 hypothetical protein [Plantibacter sp. VKM Ac-2885]
MHRRDDLDIDPENARVYTDQTEYGGGPREGGPKLYDRLARGTTAERAREMRRQGQRDEPPARGSRMGDAPPVGKGDRIHW